VPDHQSSEMTDGRPRPLSLRAIEDAITASWGPDTCDELDQDKWSPEHPAVGQCTSTAYVVNDLLGGQLLGAEVRHPDGSLQGHHYWNLLAGGLEVDLTLGQFASGESVLEPDVMERIHATPEPGADRYLALRDKVLRRLAALDH